MLLLTCLLLLPFLESVIVLSFVVRYFMYSSFAIIKFIHSTLIWSIVKSEKLKIEHFRFDICSLYLIE